MSKKYKRFNLDIAFRFQTKTSSAQVYYLLEHKSETGSFSNIQILSYMLAIWEEDMKNKRPIEPIIPVVFYHGKTNWDKPIDFSDLFEEKYIYKDYLPAFKYILIDTNKIEEERFRLNINNKCLLSALLLFKFIFLGKDLNKYSEILYIVKDLDLDKFLIYLMYITTVNDLEEEEIKTILDSTVGGDKMAPVIEKWIEKGREEGIKKGKEEGLLEGMEKGMEKGKIEGMIIEAQDLLLDAIEAKFDKVPRDIKLMVKKTKDRERLRKILKATIKVQNLDEIREMF
ncbi:Rpn family recombination-promoting nuclease/putative transposase [Thermodesulfobium narugense]|uniref:Rpn family recombination-promoting nuclease/putative transposase n=1 Tax=Thermodesulfobium narugense TaxID=184064 RepID=UPI0009FC1F4B|nr:Rpn family recombination-promoting nuclease/putative transposase [Thermodesulfobium narugense]